MHSANGAVSVAPRPVTHGIRSPQASTASAVEAVRDPLPQPGRGVEQHLQPAEEPAAERRVGPQGRQQQVVAARHVEIGRGRDLAQVAPAVTAKPAGVGVPASMYSVPPL